MQALLTVQDYLVGQHTEFKSALTKVCLSVAGVAAYKGTKPKDPFVLAIALSFFGYAYAVFLALQILLNGYTGPSALFAAATPWYTGSFPIHVIVFILMSYAPDDLVAKAVKNKYVMPFLDAAVLINTSACATAAIDANLATGAPWALIAGYLVWNGAYWLRGTKVTTVGMIQSGLTLVPYYFWDSLKGTVKVSKPNFVLGLAWLQFMTVMLEAHAKISVAGKLAALYAKFPELKGAKMKTIKGALKRDASPPKSPRSGKKTR
jgi:hypothetical protein